MKVRLIGPFLDKPVLFKNITVVRKPLHPSVFDGSGSEPGTIQNPLFAHRQEAGVCVGGPETEVLGHNNSATLEIVVPGVVQIHVWTRTRSRKRRHGERLAISTRGEGIGPFGKLAHEAFGFWIQRDPRSQHSPRVSQIDAVLSQVLPAALEGVGQLAVAAGPFENGLGSRLRSQSVRDVGHVAASGRKVPLQGVGTQVASLTALHRADEIGHMQHLQLLQIGAFEVPDLLLVLVVKRAAVESAGEEPAAVLFR
jgi:hypothetical protein